MKNKTLLLAFLPIFALLLAFVIEPPGTAEAMCKIDEDGSTGCGYNDTDTFSGYNSPIYLYRTLDGSSNNSLNINYQWMRYRSKATGDYQLQSAFYAGPPYDTIALKTCGLDSSTSTYRPNFWSMELYNNTVSGKPYYFDTFSVNGTSPAATSQTYGCATQSKSVPTMPYVYYGYTDYGSPWYSSNGYSSLTMNFCSYGTLNVNVKVDGTNYSGSLPNNVTLTGPQFGGDWSSNGTLIPSDIAPSSYTSATTTVSSGTSFPHVVSTQARKGTYTVSYSGSGPGGSSYSSVSGSGTFSCTSGQNKTLTINFTCGTGKHWDGSSCSTNTCGAQPSNTTSCNSTAPTTNNQSWSYIETCGSTACTYNCSSGYTWNGSECKKNPTVTLVASPTTIDLTQSTTLTWTVADATTCDISGSTAGSGWATAPAASNGSASVTPTVTGSITYMLTCTNGTGGPSASKTASITVHAQPTLSCSANPLSGVVSLSVTLSSTPAQGTTPYTSYNWNYGDGTTHGTTQNPTHSYTTAGTYTPTVTVVDSASYSVSCTTSTIHVCNTNYTWNSGSSTCVANTKTFTCAAKPSHSDWNTVSSYTQTWNGSAWSPADSTTTHNDTASTTSCRYTCSSGYHWDGTSQCIANTCETVSPPSGGISCNSNLPATNGQAWTSVGTSASCGTTACTYYPSGCTGSIAPNATSNASTQDGSAWHWSTTAGACTFVCNTNYTWNSGSSTCVANTKTFTCAAKPSHSDWNTVSSYTQTWDGSAWSPADSTTTHNDTASTTSCQYTCSSGYHWDGSSQCVVDTTPIDGVCGSSAATCTAGTLSTDNGLTGCGTTRTWHCDGINGGVDATDCSYANAVCSGSNPCTGTAPSGAGTVIGPDNYTTGYTPTAWTYDVNATTSTACKWKCDTNYTQSGTTCTANTQLGTCTGALSAGAVWNDGSQQDGKFKQTWNGAPTNAWLPVSKNTTYDTTVGECHYICSNGYVYDGSKCSLFVNGSCGSSNGQSFPTTPSTNLCTAGTATTVAGTGPWTWSCLGANGGTTANCSANKKVDGVCGSSNGQSLAIAPSMDLCVTGTPTVVTGTGPWTWSCIGVNGGTTASCQTTLAVSCFPTNIANGTIAANPTPTAPNVPIQHTNSSAACYVTCNNGYHWDGSGCARNLCPDSNQIPQNGISCGNDGSEPNWVYDENCSTASFKCSFKCPLNYLYNATNKTCDPVPMKDGNLHNSAWGTYPGWMIYSQPVSGTGYDWFTGVKISGTPDTNARYGLSGDSYNEDFGLVHYDPSSVWVEQGNNYSFIKGKASFGFGTNNDIQFASNTVQADCTGFTPLLTGPSELTPFGVCIDKDGYLSGYAWSTTLGWISFAGQGVTGTPVIPDNRPDKKNGHQYQVWTDWGVDQSDINVNVNSTPETCNGTWVKSATANVVCTNKSDGKPCDGTQYTYKLNFLSTAITACSNQVTAYQQDDFSTISSHLWVCGAAISKADPDNKSGFSKPKEFCVDSTPPIFNSNTNAMPPSGEYYSSIDFELNRAVISDVGSGLKGVYMFVGDYNTTYKKDPDYNNFIQNVVPNLKDKCPDVTKGYIKGNCYFPVTDGNVDSIDVRIGGDDKLDGTFTLIGVDKAGNTAIIDRRYKVTLLAPIIQSVQYDETGSMTIAGKNFGSGGNIRFYSATGSIGDPISYGDKFNDYKVKSLPDGSSTLTIGGVPTGAQFVQVQKGQDQTKDWSNKYPFYLEAATTLLTVEPSSVTLKPGDQLTLTAYYGKNTANTIYTWSGYAGMGSATIKGNTLTLTINKDLFPSGSTETTKTFTVSVAPSPSDGHTASATVTVLNKTVADSSKYMYIDYLPGTSIINLWGNLLVTNNRGTIDLSGVDLYRGEDKIKQLKVEASVSTTFNGTVKVDFFDSNNSTPLQTVTLTYTNGVSDSHQPITWPESLGNIVRPKITITPSNGSTSTISDVYRIMISAAGEGQEKYFEPYTISPDLLPSPAETSYTKGKVPFTYLTNGQCYQIATVIINKDGKPQAVVKGDCQLKADDPGFIGVTNGSTSCADLKKLHYESDTFPCKEK